MTYTDFAWSVPSDFFPSASLRDDNLGWLGNNNGKTLEGDGRLDDKVGQTASLNVKLRRPTSLLNTVSNVTVRTCSHIPLRDPGKYDSVRPSHDNSSHTIMDGSSSSTICARR